MKAGTRLGMTFGVAALALAAAPVRAQDAAPPPPADTPADAPADNSIGPRELQNFSIDGTVTRRADPPPAERPAASPPRTPAIVPEPRASSVPDARRPAPAATDAAAAPDATARPAVTASEPVRATATAALEPRTAPASSVTVPLPPIDGRMSDSAAGASVFPEADSAGLIQKRAFNAWPWLLAAFALALGGLFLWRSRAHHAFAGIGDGPQLDAFAAPAPLAPTSRPPTPASGPAPRAAPPPVFPQSPGVVSTRLRPRIDFTFKPLRCLVDDEQVVVEFELELVNSGSAPARAVLIEASLFNAGNGQDQAIGAFFADPVGQGERIAAIEPLKRFPIRSQVTASRANVQVFNIDGREVFVPLIAFNALYAWSGGDAQSSSVYLVGRDTGSVKLAPLRADLGTRQFADLGARPLPETVRS